MTNILCQSVFLKKSLQLEKINYSYSFWPSLMIVDLCKCNQGGQNNTCNGGTCLYNGCRRQQRSQGVQFNINYIFRPTLKVLGNNIFELKAGKSSFLFRFLLWMIPPTSWMLDVKHIIYFLSLVKGRSLTLLSICFFAICNKTCFFPISICGPEKYRKSQWSCYDFSLLLIVDYFATFSELMSPFW